MLGRVVPSRKKAKASPPIFLLSPTIFRTQEYADSHEGPQIGSSQAKHILAYLPPITGKQ